MRTAGFYKEVAFLEEVISNFYKQSVLCVGRGFPESTEFFTGLARKYEFQLKKLRTKSSSR